MRYSFTVGRLVGKAKPRVFVSSFTVYDLTRDEINQKMSMLLLNNWHYALLDIQDIEEKTFTLGEDFGYKISRYDEKPNEGEVSGAEIAKLFGF